MTRMALFVLRLYRLCISPYIPTTCRFYPTCSCYMMEALEKKGFWKGLSMGLVRLCKCHPFHPGGFDPVE
jgi:putative membrane protein insertion efficiency factor